MRAYPKLSLSVLRDDRIMCIRVKRNLDYVETTVFPFRFAVTNERDQPDPFSIVQTLSRRARGIVNLLYHFTCDAFYL